ncbi:protein FAM53A [Odocoileus virginianus]|uniref:Protein FAM53A n=1 Tax=Odocoileus virginianus TaxID=9874 RepID=A0ABM4HSJ6_ODOVR
MGLLLPAEERPREDVGGGRPVGSQVAVGPASPFLPSPRGPSMGTLGARDLRGSARSPWVLPTKRHGCSLSELDERAISGSPRLPGGPRVWTPVTKRRCHSSGCRLSLAQERLVPAGAAPPSAGSAPATTPASTPEPGRCQGLFHCCSQPCVCAGGKGWWKHGRAEDACWPCPALDFLKMAWTLKTSKSLCPLSYEDEDEEDARVRMALSSPWPCCARPRPPPYQPRPGVLVGLGHWRGRGWERQGPR